MTGFGEDKALAKIDALRKLEACYDRLVSIVQDDHADPQLITDLTTEADQLIDLINQDKQPVKTVHQGEERQLLASLKAKSGELETIFRKEMDRLKADLGGLKKGKKVVSAYKPPAVGMGYSEGKFVDRKE